MLVNIFFKNHVDTTSFIKAEVQHYMWAVYSVPVPLENSLSPLFSTLLDSKRKSATPLHDAFSGMAQGPVLDSSVDWSMYARHRSSGTIKGNIERIVAQRHARFK